MHHTRLLPALALPCLLLLLAPAACGGEATCDAGFVREGDVCVPACEPGFVAVEGACVLDCEPGYAPSEGECVLDCDPGYVAEGDSCILDCDPGYLEEDGECVPQSVPVPFWVDDWYTVSGLMGDGRTEGGLTHEATCPDRVEGAQGDCHTFVWTPQGSGWAGAHWMFPTDNWGTYDGLQIQPGAGAVRFMAWTDVEDVTVDFFAGLSDADGFESRCSVTLGTRPKPVELDLVAFEYDWVAGAFGWSASGQPDGVTLHIDDLHWSDEPPLFAGGCAATE